MMLEDGREAPGEQNGDPQIFGKKICFGHEKVQNIVKLTKSPVRSYSETHASMASIVPGL